MVNRQQCTPDPNPTTPNPSTHPTHPLTPAGWEESAGFRETFLYHFHQPQDAAALRHLGRMLHESALEMARYGPVTPESATREELRAALADLRHLQGFLAAVARSPQEAALQPADVALADLAGRHALALAALGAALDQALG